MTPNKLHHGEKKEADEVSTPIVLKRGDITEETVDVIVNAANSGLLGGGGVDGAIHRAGGPTILEECKRIRAERGECPTGEAVITGAGRLKARYVVHAVGPVWRGGGHREAILLARAYQNSLRLAAEHGARTIAFPSISTGAYGYPVELAAPIALLAVQLFLCSQSHTFEEVRWVLFDEKTYRVYRDALEHLSVGTRR